MLSTESKRRVGKALVAIGALPVLYGMVKMFTEKFDSSTIDQVVMLVGGSIVCIGATPFVKRFLITWILLGFGGLMSLTGMVAMLIRGMSDARWSIVIMGLVLIMAAIVSAALVPDRPEKLKEPDEPGPFTW